MIFDEVAADHRDLFAPARPYVPPPPLPRRAPEPHATAPPRRDPIAGVHQHLDLLSDHLTRRIASMEALIMSALDNLTAQADQLDELFNQKLKPALDQLADRASTSGQGVSDEQLAALESRFEQLRSGLESAIDAAVARATGTGG